jgi:hypothetical protein
MCAVKTVTCGVTRIVTGVLQKCYRSVTEVSQECCRSVAGVSH